MSLLGKINGSLIIGIFAGIFAILAAYYQWKDKNKQEAIANESKAEAKKANDRLLQLTTENLDSTKELANAYKKIATLQDELLNQVTGGDNTPILRLTVTKPEYDQRYNGYSCILSFDIVNHGDYTLQNVKSTVTDMWGRETLKYGKIIRKGLGTETYSKSEPGDYENYQVDHNEEFTAIPKNNTFPIYTAIYSPQLCSVKEPGYNVQFYWRNGSLLFFIHCVYKNDGLNIHDVELVLNGKKVDYHKYLITNMPKAD